MTGLYNTTATATCVDGAATFSCTPHKTATAEYFQMEIAPIFVIGCGIFSVFWGTMAAILVRAVDMDKTDFIEACLKQYAKGEEYYITNPEEHKPESAEFILSQIKLVGTKITDGAKSFLFKEYIYLFIWSLAFSVVLAVTVDSLEMADEQSPTDFPYTATSYLVGSITSIIAGYIGMRIAVYTNTRVTFQCCEKVHKGFITAFRGGQVLGFVLVGLALLNLMFIVLLFKGVWWNPNADKIFNGTTGAKKPIFATSTFSGTAEADTIYLDEANETRYRLAISILTRRLFELVAGYGLGGSSVALFGRVGGGIYTKAADVGADLVGKTLKDLKEDDITNPGTIADNVGDNVGDIAGMGSDLFGSLAESTCAALVVSATSYDLINTTDSLYFPLCITASGIVASFISVLLAHVRTVEIENVQSILIFQIAASTVLMTVSVIPAMFLLPESFTFLGGATKDGITTTRWECYGCIMFGLWSGMIIGFITNYYTNNAYAPTLSLARACEKGPAPNIILGIALGYMSCIIPILCITATIGYAFSQSGMYGIGLSALGMLGSLPVALSVDGYGPISDNAGGIAEMSGLPSEIRDKTDALDAAGNTTAAVGKGFAIGSACLVGLALFGAFITRIGEDTVDILKPTQFAGLLVGAMLPYAFSALTMKAVGDAAFEMMEFISTDYEKGEKLKKQGQEYEPDYQGCIEISTEASLKKMIMPGVLVIGSPLLAGFLFGPAATAGLLAGVIVSGVQVAISASNTGGAWDNAKKEVEAMRSAFRRECDEANINIKVVEADYLRLAELKENQIDETQSEEYKKAAVWGARSINLKEMHVAAVVGDTVGDPLKDTSGPAINILIKLSAITSLIFGNYINIYHVWGHHAPKA
jgi:H(+)-translocating pyrophosphatase